MDRGTAAVSTGLVLAMLGAVGMALSARQVGAFRNRHWAIGFAVSLTGGIIGLAALCRSLRPPQPLPVREPPQGAPQPIAVEEPSLNALQEQAREIRTELIRTLSAKLHVFQTSPKHAMDELFRGDRWQLEASYEKRRNQDALFYLCYLERHPEALPMSRQDLEVLIAQHRQLMGTLNEPDPDLIDS